MVAGPAHVGTEPSLRAVLFDWRGTLVVAPTFRWLVATALERLGRDHSAGSVERVLAALRDSPNEDVGSSRVDTDAGLHRQAFSAWFSAAGLDAELAEALYAVECDPTLNPFARDVGPVLQALHAHGVKLAVVSDIHVDIRPAFAAQTNPDGSTWADLVDAWILSYERGVAKPDPRAFTAALDALGVSAAETLMVGDRARYDGAAADLGITTLLVPPLRDTGECRLHRVLQLVLPVRAAEPTRPAAS